MRTRLTQKQETFCLRYFELGNATEAANLAGYSPRGIRVTASRMLTKTNIQARIKELRQKAEDETVMNVLERKQRLSEIARAVIPDFVADQGIRVSKDMPNVAAVAEITTKTRLYRKGGEPVTITNLKLHNPVAPIQELNKMDRIYSDGYQDNRTVNKTFNILVIDQETKNLISQIPQRLLNNANAHDQSIQGDSGSMGGAEEGDTA